MGIIWITHDLGLVAGIADRVMVMYAGQVVEHGPVAEIFADPQHPYTRALLGTVPSVTGPRARRLRTIEGQPPVLMADPDSCPFAPRCAPCLRPLPQRGSAADAGRRTARRRLLVGSGDRGAAPWRLRRRCVRVAGLKMHFPVYAGLFRRQVGTVKAVDDVSFDIRRRRDARARRRVRLRQVDGRAAILRLYEPTAGSIELEGRDIARLEGGALRALRPRMQMIFRTRRRA